MTGQVALGFGVLWISAILWALLRIALSLPLAPSSQSTPCELLCLPPTSFSQGLAGEVMRVVVTFLILLCVSFPL